MKRSPNLDRAVLADPTERDTLIVKLIDGDGREIAEFSNIEIENDPELVGALDEAWKMDDLKLVKDFLLKGSKTKGEK